MPRPRLVGPRGTRPSPDPLPVHSRTARAHDPSSTPDRPGAPPPSRGLPAPQHRDQARPRGFLGSPPHVPGPPPLPWPSPGLLPVPIKRWGRPALQQRPQARPASGRLPARSGCRARLRPAAHRGRALLHGLLRVLHLKEVAVGREDGDGAVVAHAGEQRGRTQQKRTLTAPPPDSRRRYARATPAPGTAHCAAGVRRRRRSQADVRARRGGAGPNHWRPGAGSDAAAAGRVRDAERPPGVAARGWASGVGGAGGGEPGGPEAVRRRRRGGRAHGATPPRPPPPSDCGE